MWVLRVGLLCFVGLVCAAILEIGVRVLLPRPGFTPFHPAEQGGLIVAHPTRGYAYAPDVSIDVETRDYRISVETNELGMRDGPPPATPDEVVSLLAIGDSFTAGHGVELEDAWPKRVEAALEGDRGAAVHVYNAGVSGYSLRQIRQYTEELLPELHPRLVLLGLFAEAAWRIEDPYVHAAGTIVQGSRLPDLVLVEGGFLSSPFESRTLRALDLFLAERSQLLCHLLRRMPHVLSLVPGQGEAADRRASSEGESADELRRTLSPLFEELALLDRSVRSAGASLVVILVNRQQADGRFDPKEALRNALVAEYAHGRGIEVIDPLPALAARAEGRPIFRYVHDFHWTPEAHALVAERVVRSLRTDAKGMRARGEERIPTRPAAASGRAAPSA